MSTKYRGINEIKVKLLPEKNKRDYVLRLVSSMIVMVFVIINFFLIFIPARNLNAEASSYQRSIYYLKQQYNTIIEKSLSIDRKLYNVKKNNEVLVIENQNVNYRKIFDDISSIKPEHSYIEDVKYNEQTSELMIYVQFDKLIDLTNYQNSLSKISYVKSVKYDSIRNIAVPEGQPRVATFYSITLDQELSPRVGDNND